MRRKWSEHETAMAKQWRADEMPWAEIAAALDRSVDSVKSRLCPRYIKKGLGGNCGWSEGPIRETTVMAAERRRLYGTMRYEDR